MELLGLILGLGMAALTIIVGRVGLFGFIGLSRWMDARVEHRDGPGLGGKYDFFQVWRDHRKSRWKTPWPTHISSPFRGLFFLWSILPGAFLLVLILGGASSLTAPIQIPLLLFLALVAMVLEGFFVVLSIEGRERSDWLGGGLLRLLALTVIAFGAYTIALHGSAPGLLALSSLQTSPPFLPIFSGPGALVVSVPVFLSIFLFSGKPPLSVSLEPSLGAALHDRVSFVRSSWALALISLWVALFFANPSTILGLLLFIPLLCLFSFVYLMLARGVSSIRVTDAYGLCLKWLVPLSIGSFLLEVVWIGVRLP
jgi:hypothetical protein